MRTTAAQWNRRLAPYTEVDTVRSLLQLTVTSALFLFSVASAFLLLRVHWALSLPASLGAGFLTVKLFIIQHDAGHRSFLKSACACDWVGRAVSLFTFTPYAFWKHDHDKHHATSGDLDRRGAGDIATKTVTEYLGLSPWGRLRYRIYRHPVTLFAIGPSWQFLIRYRLPILLGRTKRRKMAASILGHDLALAVVFGTLSAVLGWEAVAWVWLPIIVTAGTIGVWLFYVQHQFDTTYWHRNPSWSFVDAALLGCSYYRLPRWLHWLTGNIGYHHIHHLAARIPNYNLHRAFREVPELQKAPSFGILDSFRCVPLTLWCDDRRRLVSFRDAVAAA